MKERIIRLTVGIALVGIGSAVAFAWSDDRRPANANPAEKGMHHNEKVDLNSASRRELEKLPGMSSELADQVIRERPYARLDEVVRRKVLGRKQFARIKEIVRVQPPQTRRMIE